MTNILVTGASGFIGQAFLHRFAADNALALYGVGRHPIPTISSGVRYVQLDLAEVETLDFIGRTEPRAPILTSVFWLLGIPLLSLNVAGLPVFSLLAPPYIPRQT